MSEQNVLRLTEVLDYGFIDVDMVPTTCSERHWLYDYYRFVGSGKSYTDAVEDAKQKIAIYSDLNWGNVRYPGWSESLLPHKDTAHKKRQEGEYAPRVVVLMVAHAETDLEDVDPEPEDRGSCWYCNGKSVEVVTDFWDDQAGVTCPECEGRG